MPSRRQAGATSMVSSRPLGQRERGDADHVATDAGDARRSPSRRTPPGRRRRVRLVRRRDSASAPQRRGPRVLGGAPLLRVRPEQLLQQRRQQRGVGDDVVRRGQPSRRLVDQVVSGAGFDAHLVPACTTHELGDRPRGPVLGRADHQLVGDPPEVGEDLQAEDVQAGVSAARGEQRERPGRSVSEARTRKNMGPLWSLTCCGCAARMFRACQQTAGRRDWRRVVEWSHGCGRAPPSRQCPARGSCPAGRGTAPAYDGPIQIGHGQTNSQPRTVEAMLRLLEVRAGRPGPRRRCGSGWTTALLAHLTGPERARSSAWSWCRSWPQWGAENLARTAYALGLDPAGRPGRARLAGRPRRTTGSWSRPTPRSLPAAARRPARPRAAGSWCRCRSTMTLGIRRGERAGDQRARELPVRAPALTADR